jgi:hypothetical protein
MCLVKIVVFGKFYLKIHQIILLLLYIQRYRLYEVRAWVVRAEYTTVKLNNNLINQIQSILLWMRSNSDLQILLK